MPDAPSYSTPSTGGGGPPLGKKNFDPHDIQDIDQELEAYLEEKRSGKRPNFNYSVDDQLSQIRSKFGERAKPTKETEKPSIVEEVRRSHHDPTPALHPSAPPIPPSPLADKKTELEAKGAPLSHEELIRSLEEKYSQNAPVVEAKTQVDEIPQKNEEGAPLSQPLLGLRENIEPLDSRRVDALLKQALALDPEKQKELTEAFLARFKRNKERNKLFLQTQAELENELDEFIQSVNKRTLSRQSPAQSAPPQTQATTPQPSSPPPQESAPALSTTTAQKPLSPPATTPPPQTEPPPVSAPQGTPQNASMSTLVSAPDVSEKFKMYLARLPKKPTVLMYDPVKGFVRKAIDPNDESLALSYSVDPLNGLAILSVRDERGNDLGVFKFAQSEVGV